MQSKATIYPYIQVLRGKSTSYVVIVSPKRSLSIFVAHETAINLSSIEEPTVHAILKLYLREIKSHRDRTGQEAKMNGRSVFWQGPKAVMIPSLRQRRATTMPIYDYLCGEYNTFSVMRSMVDRELT